MTVLEFIGGVFTYFSVHDFIEKYKNSRSRRRWYSLAHTNIDVIRMGTFQDLANHFTNGDVDSFKKLIKSYKSKKELSGENKNIINEHIAERPEERN